MIYYVFNGIEIPARPISFFWGIFVNTITYNGTIFSKQYMELSRATQIEEYIHILQQGELGKRFYWLYVWYWFKRGLSYNRIPFELEATRNNNEEYILNRPAMNWKKY